MSRGYAWFLLLSLILLAAVPAAAQNYVYTNDDTVPNFVSAFSVSNTGALTEVAGSPFLTGGSGNTMGYFSARKIITVGNRLYAANASHHNVSGFQIDPATGALTALPGSPYPTGGFTFFGIALAASPDGRYLAAGNTQTEDITVFSIAADGSLAPVPGSPFASPSAPSSLGFTPDGRFLAVSGGTLSLFWFAEDGALTLVPGYPLATPEAGFAAGLDIDCAGTRLYVGEEHFDLATFTFGPTIVTGYTINSDGTLSLLPGSPYMPGVGRNALSVRLSVDDQALYVSNQASASLTAFSAAGDGSLALVAGSPYALGVPDPPATVLPGFVDVSADGKFVYVANFSSIAVFASGEGGALSAVAGSPFRTGRPPAMSALTAYPAKACATEDPGEPGDPGDPEPQAVAIDIMPGGAVNPINMRSRGVTPVAILSSAQFDATVEVDATSLTFGRSGDENSLKFCGGMEDVNGDGLLDLVCHFSTQETGFVPGDTVGHLKGKTASGADFSGEDNVRVLR